MNHYKLIIIGAGPAGYAAAIYAARANLMPIIITGKDIGGQLVKTNVIENWPGQIDNISGYELMNNMYNQIIKLKVKMVYEVVIKVNLIKKPFKIYLANKTKLLCDVLIIATGSSPKTLGIKNEVNFLGKGISYCAVCDGFFYQNKIVAVVGGGNAAIEASLYLVNICKKVYLIHRNNKFKADTILIIKLKKYLINKKIVFFSNKIITDLIGKNTLTTIKILNIINHKSSLLKVDGLFIAIGHIPNTQLFKHQLILDNKFKTIKTYSNTHSNTNTNIKGVFACGDVIDNIYKQALTAAGSGCMAALDAYNYLLTNNNKITDN